MPGGRGGEGEAARHGAAASTGHRGGGGAKARGKQAGERSVHTKLYGCQIHLDYPDLFIARSPDSRQSTDERPDRLLVKLLKNSLLINFDCNWMETYLFLSFSRLD